MAKKTEEIINIQDNVLLFGATVLQLSNISNLEVRPREKLKYYGPIILLLIKVLFDIGGSMGTTLIVISIISIIVITIMNLLRGDYLIITMNSGDRFFFHSMRESFMHSALHEIAARLDGNGSSEINFKYCNITSSQIATKNSNLLGGTSYNAETTYK